MQFFRRKVLPAPGSQWFNGHNTAFMFLPDVSPGLALLAGHGCHLGVVLFAGHGYHPAVALFAGCGCHPAVALFAEHERYPAVALFAGHGCQFFSPCAGAW